MRRGEVVIVDLGAVIDSGPAKRRPAVIIQDDRFNASRLATTMLVALTSNLDLAEYPGNVLLPSAVTRLRRDSVAVVTQLATVDVTRILETVAVLPPAYRDEIAAGLRLSLAL
nr:type II toxin-antitoxin system PemK/MazF family toxin [Microbacterium bovistercoris]